ncbi:MAG: hypothetical protein ABI674_01215 [Spartobacteria bacterium]
MKFFRLAPVVVLLLCAIAPSALARSWTTVSGEHFEAEFVRVEGQNGIFHVKEKDYPYPLSRLSAPDRLFIGRILNHPEEATTPAPDSTPAAAESVTEPSDSSGKPATQSAPEEKATGSLQFAGQPLRPGRGVELEVPILDPADKKEIEHAYGKPSTKVQMLLAVPDDFKPGSKPYPLLIVTATADGKASSIATAGRFVAPALEQGFVVMAVDGEFGKPSVTDRPDYRWALTATGRDALEKEWPGAKKWPVATAGTSGGGGYASYNALELVAERADFIGLFLGVSGWTPAKFIKDVKGLPLSVAQKMPIFLSAGTKDPTATPEVTDGAKHEMEHGGFRNLRFEHFDGGHQLYQPHLEAALTWFLAGGGKAGASPSPSPSAFPGHR